MSPELSGDRSVVSLQDVDSDPEGGPAAYPRRRLLPLLPGGRGDGPDPADDESSLLTLRHLQPIRDKVRRRIMLGKRKIFLGKRPRPEDGVKRRVMLGKRRFMLGKRFAEGGRLAPA